MKNDFCEKKRPPCLSDPVEYEVDLQWHSSNGALARLLSYHHRELKAAIAIAVEISRDINALMDQMAELCRRTCRFCPEPCCITNTVWFDFRDLLLFHLLGLSIPACQAISDPNDGCPFLSHRGCRLSHLSRPWMCIQYICPTHRAILESQGRATALNIRKKIGTIADQRVRMEAEVVCCIKKPKKV